MYDFLPNNHIVQGFVVTWQPEIVFFICLTKSRSCGITERHIEERWKAIGEVRLGFN